MAIDVTVRRVLPLPPEQVAAYEPPRLLGMIATAAPMPMHVTYSFEAHPHGTLAAIRVRGGPRGLLRLTEPVMSRQVRSHLAKDLSDLEHRLTDREGGT